MENFPRELLVKTPKENTKKLVEKFLELSQEFSYKWLKEYLKTLPIKFLENFFKEYLEKFFDFIFCFFFSESSSFPSSPRTLSPSFIFQCYTLSSGTPSFYRIRFISMQKFFYLLTGQALWNFCFNDAKLAKHRKIFSAIHPSTLSGL